MISCPSCESNHTVTPYKNYPFGSLLFWRTKSQLAVERKLGQFELPNPKEDYPIDYVLDGQQRLTSIFSVFQTELKPTDDFEQFVDKRAELLANFAKGLIQDTSR